MPDLKAAWGCCSKFYSTATLTQNEPRTKRDKSIAWRKTMQWERPVSVTLRWPTPETSRNTVFVRAAAEAACGGAAANASWPAWNDAWRSIPSRHENSEWVRRANDFESRQEHLFTGGWTFNRTVTALFPFSDVWLEQATRSFYGDGRRTFSVRSLRRCTAPGR